MTRNPFLPPLLTAEQVAALVQLKPATIADLARKGEIPSRKIGRARRYPRDEIFAWIEQPD